MSYTALEERLKHGGIVLLDGGTGSELERRGAAMDPEAWCGPATLENVGLLEGIHYDYIMAGADIITANTYASSRLMLEAAGFAVRLDEQNQIVSFAPERSIPFAELLVILDETEVHAAGLMHTPADVIGSGVNILRQQYNGPLMAYPDSGYFRMPHWQFEDVIEPGMLVEFARTWVDAGVQIIGGCCGLTPVHIAALRNAFR